MGHIVLVDDGITVMVYVGDTIVGVPLCVQVTNPVASYDSDGDPVNKTSDVVAAEKLELKNLLLAELQNGDLSQERTQTLLRLERE